MDVYNSQTKRRCYTRRNPGGERLVPSSTTGDYSLHLQRCLELCPELIPPSIREEHSKDLDHKFTAADVQYIIIELGCGLRPSRHGGIRLEKEIMEGKSRKAVVIHNYGHGGQGYQSSWGSATMAMSLLKEAFPDT